MTNKTHTMRRPEGQMRTYSNALTLLILTTILSAAIVTNVVVVFFVGGIWWGLGIGVLTAAGFWDYPGRIRESWGWVRYHRGRRKWETHGLPE